MKMKVKKDRSIGNSAGQVGHRHGGVGKRVGTVVNRWDACAYRQNLDLLDDQLIIGLLKTC